MARKALEAETGKPVITEQNADDLRRLMSDIIEDAVALPAADDHKKG